MLPPRGPLGRPPTLTRLRRRARVSRELRIERALPNRYIPGEKVFVSYAKRSYSMRSCRFLCEAHGSYAKRVACAPATAPAGGQHGPGRGSARLQGSSTALGARTGRGILLRNPGYFPNPHESHRTWKSGAIGTEAAALPRRQSARGGRCPRGRRQPTTPSASVATGHTEPNTMQHSVLVTS
jgi:hypothetical protein